MSCGDGHLHQLPLHFQHGCEAACSSKQRSLYLVKYCTCAHCRVESFGREALPPAHMPLCHVTEHSESRGIPGMPQSLQPLTNFCLQAGGSTLLSAPTCTLHSHTDAYTHLWPGCPRGLVSVPAPVHGKVTPKARRPLIAAWRTQGIHFLQHREHREGFF